MENKTEIEIKRNDIRNILLILFIPLLLTLVIEHFGDFTHKSYGGTIATATLVDSYFTTPFGNKVKIPDGEKAYQRHSGGTYKIQGHYTDKLPYYFKGLVKDIIYPIILIGILLIVYIFKHKYSIKIS